MGGKFSKNSTELPSTEDTRTISITVLERTYISMNAGLFNFSDAKHIINDENKEQIVTIPLSTYMDLISRQALRNTEKNESTISLKERLQLADVTNTTGYHESFLNSTQIILPSYILELIRKPKVAKTRAGSVAHSTRTTATKAERVGELESIVLSSISKVLTPFEVTIFNRLSNIVKTSTTDQNLKKAVWFAMAKLLEYGAKAYQSSTSSSIQITRVFDALTQANFASELIEAIKNKCTIKAASYLGQTARPSNARPPFSYVDYVIFLSQTATILGEKRRYLFNAHKEAEYPEYNKNLANAFAKKREETLFELLAQVVSPKCSDYIKKLCGIASPEAIQLISALIASTICQDKTVDTVMTENSVSGQLTALLVDLSDNDTRPNIDVSTKKEYLQVFAYILKTPHYLSSQISKSTRETINSAAIKILNEEHKRLSLEAAENNADYTQVSNIAMQITA